jgi:DNA-binding transcriptional ArsR family regulator
MSDDELRNQELLKAMSHPLRRRFVRLMLGQKEGLSPSEASQLLGEPLGNVSYHVRVLVGYAAVTLVDTQPARGSVQHFYRPSPELESNVWVRKVLGLDPPAEQ